MNRLPNSIRRCHIIGGPGSGKSTLARRLAAISGLPTAELDPVGYSPGGRKRPLAEKQAEIARIAAAPTWICEGIFLGWTSDLLERADVIVWLDLPWRVAAWRIGRRHLRGSSRRSNWHAGLRLLLSLLRFAHHYYRAPAVPRAAPDDDAHVTRAETEAVLRGYAGKVVRCTRAAEVAALIGAYAEQSRAWPVDPATARSAPPETTPLHLRRRHGEQQVDERRRTRRGIGRCHAWQRKSLPFAMRGHRQRRFQLLEYVR